MKAILVVSVVVAGVLASGCGGDSSLKQGDPEYARVAGLLAVAVDNYSAQGSRGLYPYTAPEVKIKCTAEQFVTAVGDRNDIGALRSIDELARDGQDTTAKLTLIAPSGDLKVDWTLRRHETGSWGVLEVPGSEACAP